MSLSSLAESCNVSSSSFVVGVFAFSSISDPPPRANLLTGVKKPSIAVARYTGALAEISLDHSGSGDFVVDNQSHSVIGTRVIFRKRCAAATFFFSASSWL